MKIPVVPIFINGLAPPLPSAQRCYALGEAVRAAIEDWPQPMRVAVHRQRQLLAGDRRAQNSARRARRRRPIRSGPRTCRTLWSKRASNDLLEEATAARMLQAGNIGGELLNWIAMLGVIGARKPRFIKPQLEQGHAYGVWRWN